MINDKKSLQKVLMFLKKPPLFLVCVNWAITLLGAIGSLIMCISGYTGVFSYVVYIVSALSLSYSVYTAIKYAKTLKEGFDKAIKSNKYIKILSENYNLRTVVTAVISLVINAGFVIFNTVFAVLNHSIWYGASAGYYLLLSLLKGGIFYADVKIKKKAENDTQKIILGQLKNYRFCGIALLIVELAMTGVVTLMVLQERPAKYTDIVAITFAAFTFYKLTFSIINFVKAGAQNNPLIQSIRNIGLAETALSVVSLQMALVSTFSDGAASMTALNAIVGFAACALTIGIGVFMIAYASLKLKNEKIKQGEKLNECD